MWLLPKAIRRPLFKFTFVVCFGLLYGCDSCSTSPSSAMKPETTPRDQRLFPAIDPSVGLNLPETEEARTRQVVESMNAGGYQIRAVEDDATRLVIKEHGDGSYAFTKLFLFAPSSSHDANRLQLLSYNLGTIYNPALKAAIFIPSIEPPIDPPLGWSAPNELARHCHAESEFVIAFKSLK